MNHPPRAAVAAGHTAVVEAATEVLGAGGNAFDAVVAAGFAATVAEPGLTSLAGGSFVLARTAAGEAVLVDAFVDTPGRGLPDGARAPEFESVLVQFPAAVQQFHCGLGSVAVPGTLPGLLHVHRRFGRLSLPEVTAPAARLARDGVVVGRAQGKILGLLEPILRRTPEAEAVFAPGGRLLAAGDVLRNESLAAFIADVGTGRVRGFGDPSVAGPLVSAMEAGGGLVTAEDLASYAVIEREPLAAPFRGRTLLTNPSPSFGGRLLALALRLLDGSGVGPGMPDATRAAALVDVMAEVDRRRAVELAAGDVPPTQVRGTTHVSVADSDGNVASMTASNGECSGDVVPGTGVLLNNMLGEDDLHPDGFHAFEPGVRVASMMAPSVLLGPDGTVEAVLGSGGSKRIRTALMQVVERLTAGVAVADAVQGPRLHWDTDHVEAEPGWPDDAIDRLRERAPVNLWPDLDVYFGGVHAVAPGHGTAAGDPRRDGAAAVLPRADLADEQPPQGTRSPG